MKFIIGIVLFLMASVASAQSRMYPEKEAANKSRAQIPVPGASNNFSPTAASAAIVVRGTANAVYMITCSQDTHVRWSNTVACTAVATDFLMAAGTVLYYAVGPALEASYVCGIRDTADGICFVLEVR